MSTPSHDKPRFSDEENPGIATSIQGDNEVVIRLSKGQRIAHAIVGAGVLAFAVTEGWSLKRHVGTYVGASSLLPFLIGLLLAAGSTAGASYLRMDAKGVSLRQLFIARHIPWKAVASITEMHRRGVKHSRWGLLVSTQAGSGVRGLFIPDVYCVKRSELIQIMQRLWNDVHLTGS